MKKQSNLYRSCDIVILMSTAGISDTITKAINMTIDITGTPFDPKAFRVDIICGNSTDVTLPQLMAEITTYRLNRTSV
jgi:hypothetical protein